MIVWTVWFIDCGELAYHPDVEARPPAVLAVYATPEDAAEACAAWCADQQPCEVRQLELAETTAGGHELRRDTQRSPSWHETPGTDGVLR